ncbi:MAG: hypothetical protein Q9200_007555 [Gallowayella weberi]
MPEDGDNRRYLIDTYSHITLQHYFKGLFHGSVNMTSNNPAVRTIGTNDATLALFNPVDIFGRKDDGEDKVAGRGEGLDGLQKILDNTTTAMTNLNADPGNSRASIVMINGTADGFKIYVEVQWGWIAAPVALLIGTVVFFIATVISSSSLPRRQKVQIWKSSILPLLKALDADLHEESFNGMRTTSEMDDWARDVPVQLTRDVDGDSWKLVRR